MAEERTENLDLSEPEDAEDLDLSPFQVNWLDLDFAGCPQKLGISALPGCRFKKTWRSLNHVSCLKEMGIEEIFSLVTTGEMKYYRAPNLLEKFAETGMTCHHHPIEDGHVPEMSDLMNIIEEIRVALMAGKKTIIHCFGGYGRSCAVSICLMMVLDPALTSEEAQEKLKALRGDRAIQSVKQYNFITEFRDLLNKFNQESKGSESRSISR